MATLCSCGVGLHDCLWRCPGPMADAASGNHQHQNCPFAAMLPFLWLAADPVSQFPFFGVTIASLVLLLQLRIPALQPDSDLRKRALNKLWCFFMAIAPELVWTVSFSHARFFWHAVFHVSAQGLFSISNHQRKVVTQRLGKDLCYFLRFKLLMSFLLVLALSPKHDYFFRRASLTHPRACKRCHAHGATQHLAGLRSIAAFAAAAAAAVASSLPGPLHGLLLSAAWGQGGLNRRWASRTPTTDPKCVLPCGRY